MFGFWKKRAEDLGKEPPETSVVSGFGIQMNEEEYEIERQKNAFMWMKYSKNFIDYFDASILKNIEPKNVLTDMRIDAFHRACRHFDIIKFKKYGFVKKVTIHPVDGCPKIEKFKKTHNLDEVPELPLKGCDQQCMCYYEPIIPKNLAE